MAESKGVEWVDRVPEEGARLWALRRLDDAASAWRRLEDPRDREALHDFRVSLRRLRSLLRAFGTRFEGDLPRKLRRRLGRLAASTGAGRDAEVLLEWLGALRRGLPAEARAGARFAAERWGASKAAEYRKVRSPVRRRFARLESDLRRRLGVYRLDFAVGEPPRRDSFLRETARLLRDHLGALLALLAGVTSPADDTPIHDARIAGKRLRYLLEMLADDDPRAAEAVRELKRLQDLLGALHDLQVFADRLHGLERPAARRLAAARRAADRVPPRIAEAVPPGEAPPGDPAPAASPPEAEAAPFEDERPGLAALAARAAARKERLFLRLRREALDPGLADLRLAVAAVASGLDAAARRGIEIERKYLLRTAPPELIGREGIRIEQGWLPGDHLRERLRRSRQGREERLTRCVKVGLGIERLELEEAAPPDLFRRLWPLTRGRRVLKIRYDVPDGAHVWSVDVFLDRPLVLAEVELPSPELAPAPPDWLAPYLVREVTGDPRYVNSNLAK